MGDTLQPQLYLITPPEIDLSTFPSLLQGVLDVRTIACIRLAPSSQDETLVIKTADALREIAHARDIPLVIERHVQLVERLGLDGVHLTDGGRGLRKIRDDLGDDPIIGAHCGTSRHDGLSAGEAGADYIAFGPVRATVMGDGSAVEQELFEWWSEVIEIPVVAEGNLSVADVERLAPFTDFFAVGAEIWGSDDPAQALRDLTAPLF